MKLSDTLPRGNVRLETSVSARLPLLSIQTSMCSLLRSRNEIGASFVEHLQTGEKTLSGIEVS